MASEYFLPSKISSYLQRLDLEYARSGRSLFREMIKNARVAINEATEYDNWNGGTYGHDVIFFLPPEILSKIPLDKQKEICAQLREDLAVCSESVSNEFFNAVNFDIFDESDPLFQGAVPVFGRPQTNPDTLPIWKTGYVRLFISHRDKFKGEARSLADALDGYGVSAFVAHDTIEPMTSWQHEIIKGLETMEIMLTFLTDDFHDSTWTNQEVGYALGKGIPIISLKLEEKNPAGFIDSIQALKGSLENPTTSTSKIYDLIANKLGQKDRLQQTLIAAFLNSPDFSEAKVRFDRMVGVVKSLSEGELTRIIEGFNANDQLHNAGHLTSKNERLRKFLERCTGKEFTIEGRDIAAAKSSLDDDIPF